MSLSSALSNAVGGLGASAKRADLISNNIANAQTPGYTRRAAELGAAVLSGQGDGVRVLGVTLVQDTAAIANRRLSDASLGAETAASGPLSTLSNAMGVPGSATALAELAADLEIALTAAANEPNSDPRLSSAVTSADRLVDKISGLASETQDLRAQADGDIARLVNTLNENLASIEEINGQIVSLTVSGADTTGLMDLRKSLIDEISGIVPIREVTRNTGEVALFTANGGTLLDGRAAEVGFTATPLITQDMTLASTALSGLTLGGLDASVGSTDGSGVMDGGSLGALFITRDQTLPTFADQLDLLAEDLVERFQDPAIDATRAAGDAGLFTDDGAAYDPLNLAGLAGRLGLNAAVDPDAGGAVWRLRDGLGAAAPGLTGDGALLASLSTAATTPRAPSLALGFTGAGGIAAWAAGLTGTVATQAETAEANVTYAATLNQSFRDSEVATSGVDTDRELQELLQVEQAYAANALVLSTVDQMINRLLEI